MFLRRREKSVTRGQALVEFALVLPLLALLLVVAVDFGRVFFGWVSLTNAARVGANYAGYTPNLLSNPTQRDEYEVLIADAVTGCNLAPADMNDPSYDPTFSDGNGDTTDGNNDWGDFVTVNLGCQFDLITPLAEVLFGDLVSMRAEAVFPIRSGSFAGPGGGGTPPTAPCTQSLIPDLINRTLENAQLKWADEGFDPAKLTYEPNPGAASDWLVLGGANAPVYSPGAVINDCVDPSLQYVHLTLVAPPPCAAGLAQVPDLRGELVADARQLWEDAGFDPAEFRPTSADNTKTVLTQVTDPATSPAIGGCVVVTAEVTITFGDPPADPCDVPNLISMTLAEAQLAWQSAGFTTTISHTGGPAAGTVHQQVPINPGIVDCGVVGQVRTRN